MITSRNVDIETWDPASEPHTAARRESGPFFPPAVWGIAGALLIHLLLVPGLFFSVAPPPSPIKPPVAAAGPLLESTDLVLIDVSGSKSSRDDLVRTSLTLDRIASSLYLTETPHIDIPASGSEAAAEAPDAGRLTGIYSGQIHARIERIWRRPRTPVSESILTIDLRRKTDEFFHCLVRIIQDSSGWVQETQLLSCNGSVRWQQSLVTAINQASPLPAPPDRRVFATAITLDFVGYEFSPGASTDGYELQNGPLLHSDKSMH